MSMDERRILLSTGSLFHLPLPKIFNIAHRAGFRAVELMVDDNKDTYSFRKLNTLSKKYGIQITAIHSPLDKMECFTHGAGEIISKSVVLAKRVGARRVIAHAYRDKYPQYAKDIAQVAERYSEVCIENTPYKKEAMGSNVFSDPKKIISMFGSLCFDTSHCATTQHNFEKTFTAVLPNVQHVHFSDSCLIRKENGDIKDQHLLPGDGVLPLKWLVSTVQNRKGIALSLELDPAIIKGMTDKDIIAKLSTALQRTMSWLRS